MVDSSMWLSADGGRPLFTVRALRHWLAYLPESLEAGRLVIAAAAWPAWREQADSGALSHLLVDLDHTTSRVRYPAGARAYLFAPIRHRAESERLEMGEPRQIEAKVITVLLEDNEWRVHSVGPMVNPAELRRVAYSW